MINNNLELVTGGVALLVDYGWDRKDEVETVSVECANKLLDKIIGPLPDMAEVIVDALIEPKIATFFKSAFTIKDISTKEVAVSYIMGKLKTLK